MVHAFQLIFQAAHDKRDLDFKGPKSVSLKEHFANLNIHDQTWDVDGINLYFTLSSPAHFDCSIPHDFFDDPSSNMIIFVNMISLHKIDHFASPLDDDPFSIFESMDSLTSSSGASSSHSVYYLPHSPLGEASCFDLILSIFYFSGDDHSYLPILK